MVTEAASAIFLVRSFFSFSRKMEGEKKVSGQKSFLCVCYYFCFFVKKNIYNRS